MAGEEQEWLEKSKNGWRRARMAGEEQEWLEKRRMAAYLRVALLSF